MILGMGIIACIIIFFGLFPNLILDNIIDPVARAIFDYSAYIGGVL